MVCGPFLLPRNGLEKPIDFISFQDANGTIHILDGVLIVLIENVSLKVHKGEVHPKFRNTGQEGHLNHISI